MAGLFTAPLPPPEAVAAALLSTLLISLAPNLILFLSPDYKGKAASDAAARHGAVLSVGQALAAGGLLGDVFLHTLPHSLGDGHAHAHAHDHDHDHRNHEGGFDVGLVVLFGFGAFLVFDIFVRSVGGQHSHGHGHGHGHENGHENGCEKDHSHEKGQRKESNESCEGGAGISSIFNSTVVLNLAADSLHNFTDGLAIGASFAAVSQAGQGQTILSLLRSRGGMASLSVLLHELPHELGDFSILVSNGMSKMQAIRAQFGTALAAFAGTMLGLAASTFDERLGHDVLIPFTAGGFVYLAAVSILPGVLEEPNVGAPVRMLQIAAFALGVAFMHLVSILEEIEEGGGDHYHGSEL